MGRCKQVDMKVIQEPQIQDVRRLLEQNNLLTEDLTELNLMHFFICGEPSNPRGLLDLKCLVQTVSCAHLQ